MATFTLPQLEKGITSIGHGPVVDAMAEAFKMYSSGQCHVEPVQHLALSGGGDFCVKSGFIKNDASMVVKIAGGGFDGHGSSGIMAVFSQATGTLNALLIDNGWLTDLRTAAAGSLCAKFFAPAEITAIGVVGSGVQARFQMDVLRSVTYCRKVVLFGRNAGKAQAAAADIAAMGYSVHLASSVGEMAAACNLIFTTTSAKEPIFALSDVTKHTSGTLVVALGSDGIGKQELDAGMVGAADLVLVDSMPQCVAFGEASHAIKTGVLAEGHAKLVELGTGLAGDHTRNGRNDSRFIIADLTGVAVQDVAIAQLAMAAVKALPESSL